MVKYAIKEIYGMADSLEEAMRIANEQAAIYPKPPPGGERPKLMPPTVNVYSKYNKLLSEDMRARIRVPGNYIRPSTAGSFNKTELVDGIIFPYTPQISYDQKADYQSMSTIHSNYTQYFYKSSNVGAINIQARFTVQNSEEALVYLSVKHLLSALTKMPYADDPGAGAPPPICRLDAYGSYMLKNVPVVISSFRIELPNDVDYFSVSKEVVTETSFNEDPVTESQTSFSPMAAAAQTAARNQVKSSSSTTEQNFVPMAANFAITCIPVYSRREMLQFSLKNFLENYTNNTKYL